MKDMYYMINTRGMIILSPKSGKHYELRKKFGDCFRTEKQAEIALKRIKSIFKRMK
jgi:hypothetical protein